jgi:hypothetical protein
VLSSLVKLTATMSKEGAVVEFRPKAMKESGVNMLGDAADENTRVPFT